MRSELVDEHNAALRRARALARFDWCIDRVLWMGLGMLVYVIAEFLFIP